MEICRYCDEPTDYYCDVCDNPICDEHLQSWTADADAAARHGPTVTVCFDELKCKSMRFSVECIGCQIRIDGKSEIEVKNKIQDHQVVEHPDEGIIRWERIQ